MDIFIRNKPYRGHILAVVLDWAGTAVDYGCMGPVAVFIEVFRDRGVEVTPAEARGPMGLKKIDHVRALCAMDSVAERWRTEHGRRPGEEDVLSLYAETEPRMVACIADHSDPIPGLLDVVKTLRGQGVKIGSTTGYTAPMLDVLKPKAAAKGYAPDASFCSSDAPAGRPWPFMCWKNAIALEVYPLEAMVKIGDTVADIEEGLNAGMWTVGVTKSGNGLGLTQAEAEALPPAELASRLAAASKTLYDAGAHYVVEGIWDCLTPLAAIEARLRQGERP